MTVTPARNRILGAILAGGLASRMGGLAKGMLEIAPHLTVAERLLEQFARAGIDEVIISTNDPQPYRPLGKVIVPDLRQGMGPLGGIEAALAWSLGAPRRFDAVGFLPCDLPGITAREISALVEAFQGGQAPIFVAETGKSFCQALCCIVHNGILPDISARIDAGRRGVSAAWRSMNAEAVHFDDEAPFANINTLDDLENWNTPRSRDL